MFPLDEVNWQTQIAYDFPLISPSTCPLANSAQENPSGPFFPWSEVQTEFWSLSSIAIALIKVFLACLTLCSAIFALTHLSFEESVFSYILG